MSKNKIRLGIYPDVSVLCVIPNTTLLMIPVLDKDRRHCPLSVHPCFRKFNFVQWVSRVMFDNLDETPMENFLLEEDNE